MQACSAQFTFKFIYLKHEVSVLEFTTAENISHVSGANLVLLSEEVISCDEVVRQEGLLTIVNPEGTGSPDRYFHGILRKFRHSGMNGRFHVYEAQLVPYLWLLSIRKNCRIFQDMQLKDIVITILLESGISSDLFEFRLVEQQDIFNKFNMQYNETDLHFISRLLENEGIFYFFEHYEDKNVLVFSDCSCFYRDIEGDKVIPLNAGGMASGITTSISTFDFSDRLRPGVYKQTNFNFKTPSHHLETTFASQYSNPCDQCEVYSYPGSYGETQRGDRIARIRLETLTALKEKARGASNCTRLTAGAAFQLSGHSNPKLNQRYFLFGVAQEGKQPSALQEFAPNDVVPEYGNIFMAIPSSTAYRPEQRHEKPFVPGLLSAVVTGPEGEEIWTDEYGRVKVRFHFDREGTMDEKSSCWLRVMHSWGGSTWGSQHIPRVGDEVLISFINGDMDYPIVVGSAINAAKLPIYSLPINKTQSGIKTRSTPGGDPSNFNELRFEDKKGAEEVYLQGEKDWNILIKNNKVQTIGGSSGTTVAGALSEAAKTITLTAEQEIRLVCGDSTIILSPSGVFIQGDKIHAND